MFSLQLHFAFQDAKYLYMVMDYCAGMVDAKLCFLINILRKYKKILSFSQYLIDLYTAVACIQLRPSHAVEWKL